MMFLSIGLRALVNVEALNMVESIGNVTRHRRATIVKKTKNGYVLRVVPAISGESIAHAYQSWIVRLALKTGLPVCEFCEKEEFLKHADLNFFGNKKWEQELKKVIEKREYDPHEIEKTIIANCIVEDIGGFLYPGVIPVKRTSRFQVGYMIPALDALDKASIEPQFHVRHSPSQLAGAAEGQMMYYVEIGSAVYTLTFNLDIGGIGKTSMLKVENVIEEKELKKRVEVSLDSLALMLDTKIFGAKLSRFTPVIEYESVITALSKKYPFTVSPPSASDYISETVMRAHKYGEVFDSEIKIYGFNAPVEGVENFNTLIDLFSKIKEEVLTELK